MKLEEQRKDWLFRYNTVYKKRKSHKQKSKFLRSFTTDLQMMDKDFKIMGYDDPEDKVESTRNIYVGDIKNAKKIVATYYDTPSKHFGAYHYFDVKKNGKNTIYFTMILSVIYLILGILATIYIMSNNFEILSFTGLLVILFYFLYFYIFSKITKGIARRNNLIQNTSSLVILLDYINNSKSRNKVAYAFLDKGTTNKDGLNYLLNDIDATTKVMYLDSIGASLPIEVVDPLKVAKNKNSNRSDSFMTHKYLNYVLAKNTETNDYSLDKSELKSKEINEDNLKKTNKIIKDFLKG